MTVPSYYDVKALAERLLDTKDGRAQALALKLSRASTDSERVEAYANALGYFPTSSVEDRLVKRDGPQTENTDDG